MDRLPRSRWPGAATPLLACAVVVLASAGARAQAGRATPRVDVDGDGHADVVVAETGGPGGDRILVHRGGPGGPRLTQTLTTLDGASFSLERLVAIGDVDGDRRTDVLAVTDHGVARVLLGSPAGLVANHAPRLVRPDGETNGVTWAAAGDVDGDGLADVAARVGCVPAVLEVYPPIEITCRDASQRHLYVWSGARGGPPSAPSFALHEPATASEDTPLLAPLGDLDGDGYDELGRSVGATFVIHRGGPRGPSRQPAARLLDGRGRPLAAANVAAAGDLDGDGLDDLAVVVYDDVRQLAFVARGDRRTVLGRATRLPRPRGAVLDGWVAGGDVDGDGRGDAVFSTFIDDARRAVLVYRGGRLGAAPQIVREPAGNRGQYGIVSLPGDVDGDGAGDLVVGSPICGAPIGGDVIGRVYVYRGALGGLAAGPSSVLEGGRGAAGDLGLHVASPGGR